VTVHPLGGCGMGEDATRGVVNDRHQVFSGKSGTDVHEGLYVMDGAVMPRSIGVNPILTISGLAERACEYLLKDEGRELVDDAFVDAFPEESWRPKRLGLRFTEKMAGHVDDEARTITDSSYASEERSYRWAEKRGRRKRQALTVVLDMEIDDVDRLIEDPLHEVKVSGVVHGAGLPGGPGMVVKGSYARILTWSEKRVNHKTMIYWLNVVTADGRKWVVEGEKWVRDHIQPLPLWRETTALYVRVRAVASDRAFEDVGDGGGLEEVALGIIHVGFVGFLKQVLVTQRPVNARGFFDGWGARLRFNKFFVSQVVPHMNPAFYPARRVERAKPRVPSRSDSLPECQEYRFETEDGVELRLSRYRGGDNGAVLLLHGLGVSSRIFSIDTLGENLLEHLYSQGYDVWLLDYRASIELPSCFSQFDADTVAKYDHPKAIEKVLEETGEESLRVVAHCFGATTFFMSMLGGHIEPEKIRSVVISQVATHMTTGSDTRLKAGVRAGNQLWWLLRWRFPNAYTDDAATPAHRRANYALRFWRTRGTERCRSDVCHRIRFLYSRLFEHEQLDPETHDALHEMFGVANMTAMRHLAEMSRQGKLVDANGGDIYIDKMGERLPFPIRFIHGSRNECYHPVSTWTTWKLLEELRKANPQANPGPYDWHEIPDLGHIDCIFGHKAADRVYPKISAHFAVH
jgi:cholesterol oxidase